MALGTAMPQTAKFMGPTWGPPGLCRRPQVGPMLAPLTLLSGAGLVVAHDCLICLFTYCSSLWAFSTVYPKKYAHGFCFAVLCCGYTLTDFPISIRLTSLALWQSNDCPSASKATLMNMDKYFMWIHYERLHNHNKAKHNKTVCIFLGIYCIEWNLSPQARAVSQRHTRIPSYCGHILDKLYLYHNTLKNTTHLRRRD